MNGLLAVIFTLFWRILSLGGAGAGGGSGGYYYDDYDYHLDYHRPRDREIALQLQAKAVENQGSMYYVHKNTTIPSPRHGKPHSSYNLSRFITAEIDPLKINFVVITALE